MPGTDEALEAVRIGGISPPIALGLLLTGASERAVLDRAGEADGSPAATIVRVVVPVTTRAIEALCPLFRLGPVAGARNRSRTSGRSYGRRATRSSRGLPNRNGVPSASPYSSTPVNPASVTSRTTSAAV